jgi:hypothetical protein
MERAIQRLVDGHLDTEIRIQSQDEVAASAAASSAWSPTLRRVMRGVHEAAATVEHEVAQVGTRASQLVGSARSARQAASTSR